jgi:hypothetical protein
MTGATCVAGTAYISLIYNPHTKNDCYDTCIMRIINTCALKNTHVFYSQTKLENIEYTYIVGKYIIYLCELSKQEEKRAYF